MGQRKQDKGRRTATHHALRPLVDDLDQAELELIVEALVGKVCAMPRLHGPHAFRDAEDGGLALHIVMSSGQRELGLNCPRESNAERTSSSLVVSRGSTSVFSWKMKHESRATTSSGS